MGASSQEDDAATIKAARKVLKKQESGSMKIKSLAKKVASKQKGCKEAVRKLIEGSSTCFSVEGKFVKLLDSSGNSDGSRNSEASSKRRKRKSDDSEDKDTASENEGDHNGTCADAKKAKVEGRIEEKNAQSALADAGDYSGPRWTTFGEAPFAAPIQGALKSAGFATPSPIQTLAWPACVEEEKDVVAVAKTGSGKTLGFLLPVFHRIHQDNLPGGKQINAGKDNPKLPSPLCLVMSPTRELAVQIHGEAVKFGAKTIGISSACVYGGTDLRAQTQELRRMQPAVLIATPGRLVDLMERKVLSLARCQFLVLDEADRMLDMGFEPQLKAVVAAVPEKENRQTLFFTATWPKNVRRVAKTFLREEPNVREIFIGEGAADGELVANKAVTQVFFEAQDDEKDDKLYQFLLTLKEDDAVVVFANTKRRVDYIAKTFYDSGFSTCAIHGDKQQSERDVALKKFVAKECCILVATDVAARGLDIKGVTHVINFDMARDVESYVHRIGRTGRAGELGKAITFWNKDYDIPCSPALVQIARNAGQDVPDFLRKYEKTKPSKQWKVAAAQKAAATIM